MKDKKAYWIGGTITGLLGIGLVRLLAPELDGVQGTVAVAAGYLLVIAGITIVARATGRKGSEPFITIKIERKD